MRTSTILLLALSAHLIHAADVTYSGVSGGEWATAGNWSSSSYPGTLDVGVLDTTANLSVAAPNNIQGIRIGTNGSGRLQIGSQATLTANSSSSETSIIGNGSGNQGYVQQEGGTVAINRLEIGNDSASGSYHIHSGSLSVTRESGGTSLFLAKNGSGTGSFRISSGSLITRAGVQLGSNAGGIGRFEVIGSHPGSIAIGSLGTIAGAWTQHPGSTLSVRIDKSTKGVTPIFVDGIGLLGGGNVVFESGSFLEVDFTAAFLNGGTYTVMEWGGSVTNNGLQLAPSVDTNIWSFQVDAANKRLTVTAAGNPLARNLVHPGTSHKRSDLERMRDMVAAGIEPYATSFQQLSSQSRAKHTYSVLGNPANTIANLDQMTGDGTAAYYNALMWNITGDERHAQKAVQIFNAWSNITRNTASIPLSSGLAAWRMLDAAEIIRHTYEGWSQADIDRFSEMLVYPGYSNTTAPSAAIASGDVTIYWRIYNGDPARHGNQGIHAMRTLMAMAIFLDHEIMYDRALRYLQGAPAREDDIPYPSGPSIADTQIGSGEYFDEFSRSGQASTNSNHGYNEAVHNYIWPNGQCQESSRDQEHAVGGVHLITLMSEMAWSQGDDLYGHLDNRLLLGMEYSARYNLSYTDSFPDQPTPWEPTVESGEFIQRLDRSGRWFSKKINPFVNHTTTLSRGDRNKHSVYESNLAHYKDRLGLPGADYKWLERGLEIITQTQGVEGQGSTTSDANYGGLTMHRTSPGDPIRGFINGSPDFAMNSLPMTIEAENYDYFPIDGEGRTYHDLSAANSGLSYRPAEGVDLSSATDGGFAVSSIMAGEWLTYTVSVPSTANYNLSLRYASTAHGGTIRFNVDGADVTGDLAIPHGAPASTGASNWKNLVIATDVPLTQGVKKLTVSFGGSSDAFLLNSFTIEETPVDPIAHWRFDEGAGAIAADCSGNGHHGTINNAIWTTRSGGGNALSFNGTNANVSLPASAFASLDKELTLAFWAYGDSSLPSENCAFWAGTSGGGRILNVHLPWNDTHVYFDASDRINKSASAAETENSWAHWTFTKNANTGSMKIYRNGTLWHSDTNKTNSIATIAQAFIGSQNGERYYPGLLDDFRLFDVALSPTAISSLYADSQSMTAEHHVWQGGESIKVTMSAPTGTAGTDWDLLTIECPLILDAGLTPGNPFQIDLDAASLNFDNRSDQSWLIVTTPEILGTFDPGAFIVDTSDFESSNPLAGGSFSITNIGNELFLNFTATEPTALESWRFTHFETHDNTGEAADAHDADLDGIANLLEYATGTDPNNPSGSPFRVGPNTTGSELELTFNRIADPSLNYFIEGTGDLGSAVWDPVWSGTGTAADTVTIPESLWPAGHDCYFFRLGVSY